MKKILLVMAAASLMFACNSKSNKDRKTDIQEQSVINQGGTQEEPKPDMHTSQNSIDFEGTYVGSLPTASGSGMKVTIVLAGDTYKKTMEYTEKKEKPFERSGKFSWDPDGSVITLEGDEAPNKYLVGENQIIQLDMKGQMIEGSMADKYVLKKQ